jgi:hypothetical protein
LAQVQSFGADFKTRFLDMALAQCAMHRCAGVSPAIFLISIHCKNAGETPVPRHIAPSG